METEINVATILKDKPQGLPQRRQANLVGTISYLKKFPAYQQ